MYTYIFYNKYRIQQQQQRGRRWLGWARRRCCYRNNCCRCMLVCVITYFVYLHFIIVSALMT